MIFPFTQNPNLKRIFFGGGVRGGRGGVGGLGDGCRWMDRRPGTNQLASSTSSKLGA